jgi:hypothetical protein
MAVALVFWRDYAWMQAQIFTVLTLGGFSALLLIRPYNGTALLRSKSVHEFACLMISYMLIFLATFPDLTTMTAYTLLIMMVIYIGLTSGV